MYGGTMAEIWWTLPPCVHQSCWVGDSFSGEAHQKCGRNWEAVVFFLYLEGPSKGPKHRDLLVVLHSDATKFADIGRL
jgi:hypothetical protein